MRTLARLVCVVTCLTLLAFDPALAQRGGRKGKPPEAGADAKKEDSKKKKGPKDYDEVITEEMTTDPGLFTVHRDGDDIYFEIPTDELGKDMVWVTQLAETQAGYSWAGMPIGNRVVRWEQRGDRILLRDVKFDIRADVDDPIALAVEATSVPAIIHTFDVAAYGKNKAPVIKVSDLFAEDRSEFSAKESLGAKGLDKKRTFIEQVKSFPTNIETKVLATYTLQQQRPGAGGPAPAPRRFPTGIRTDRTQSGVTVLLHHSMVRLPDEPMQPRVWDDRVGFFRVGFTDFGDDTDHEAKTVRYITRWRLEKQNPKAEVSEPVKPIVWYVSREVPEKWQESCIKGIEMWQPAFEAAGFENAIVGKLAPSKQEDPDWDPEDARYTTIRWLPSAVPNAFGPHIHDPRSGEILEADVRMFHNVIKLLRDWYFVQAAASDERAQHLPMPDDLMGELIAFVVAHEVGHSLGFPHNMKASSNYSVAELRDAKFTKKMGTAPSIMDYARFNYVAQPQDRAALMPQIGPYDHFAAEWGYRQFPADADEQAELESIVARQVNDPMLRFGNPNPFEDPTQQTEDLGSPAVEATAMGIRNLERIAGFVVEATSNPGEDYSLLDNMHRALLGQWRREMVHVANVVGGVEQINLYYGDADRRFFPIDAGEQRAAIEFLNANAFATPMMFLADDITGRIGAAGSADRVLQAQGSVLSTLVNEQRVKRMSEAVAQEGGDVYRPDAMMADLTAGIWSELDSGESIDLYRRNLQRAHVGLLSERLESDDPGSDMPALARGELIGLLDRFEAVDADEMTSRHLQDVAARIRQALDKVLVEQRKPPGSGTPRGRGLEDF